MIVKTYPYGPLSSNMYFLSADSGCFLIDPSVSPHVIEDDLPGKIDYILITHGHFDHIYAVDQWAQRFPEAKIYCSSDDFICFEDPSYNSSHDFFERCEYKTRPLAVETLKLDGFSVIHTPGHSKGSVCYLFEQGEQKLMFTGDMLFAGSIGRTDLKGGEEAKMMESIGVLKKLSSDIIIYPGHGPSSILNKEFLNNPFFNL
ncbi:MAG: MBL fold metallo-hydrolase [Clostridiales bacterium]|nr:MBL fold metallo-hydrolase [Clostridiales bacterium]